VEAIEVVQKACDLINKASDPKWNMWEREFIKDLVDIDGYYFRPDQIMQIEKMWERI